jgi:hypothetical protein
MNKFAEATETVTERLQTISTAVFFSAGKRLCVSQQDTLDMFIDFACMVSKVRIDFAMPNIIYDLLRLDPNAPEYIHFLPFPFLY